MFRWKRSLQSCVESAAVRGENEAEVAIYRCYAIALEAHQHALNLDAACTHDGSTSLTYTQRSVGLADEHTLVTVSEQAPPA